MKLKKGLFILLMMITILVVAIGQVNVYAATTETLYVRRATNRTGHLGYAINNPKEATNGGAQTIWSLLPMKSEISDEYFSETEEGYRTLYCLDITKWMGNIGSNETSSNTVTYNRKSNMITDKQTIVNKYSILGDSLDGISNYNALLWLMDNIYIPNDEYYTNNVKEKNIDKLALLKAAGISSFIANDGNTYYTIDGGDIPESELLTDDDIEAIQQAVMWRYTVNSSTTQQTLNTLRHNINDTDLTMYYTSDNGATYNVFSNIEYIFEDGTDLPARDIQAVMLYDYLTKQADNAGKTAYTSVVTSPISVDITNLTAISNNNYRINMKKTINGYVLGPINILKNNDLSYNIDLQVKDGSGNSISGYYFSNSSGETLGANKTVNDLVGQGEFYITVPDTSKENINVNINTSYRITDKYVWDNTTTNTYQPIAEPEINKVEEGINLVAEEKLFDLTLRKYITKMDNSDLTNTRVPVINEASLKDTTKAIYNHRKDPLIVKTGNIVTYNISIYNEGEKEGYASQIVDQLPTGLKSTLKTGETVTSSKGNTYKVEYDEINNKITLILDITKAITQLSANTNITDNVLDLDTIQLSCTVVEKPDTTNSKILTNIAYISEEVSIEDDGTKTTIVNEKGKDRDSEPGTKPGESADQLLTSDIGYTGKNQYTESELNNENAYFEGEQDDDDFEKIKILPQLFDLKLIKFITAVNNVSVENRVKSIDMSKLNSTDESGNLITTGDYILEKNPVSVQKGDYITYTLRIYNEGDISGYAKEISEDIPEGLEYVWADGITINEDGTINFENTTGLTQKDKEAIEYNLNRGWAVTENGFDAQNNRITEISTNYLSKETNKNNLIQAFDINNSTVPDYKEVTVMLKAISSNSAKNIIRNEAAITEDCDSDGNDITDSDSKPEEWKKENLDKYYDEDKKWPVYKEDDEDYDSLIIKQFDLALRKFITAIEDEKVSTRVPQIKNNNGKITYEHDKTPVNVLVGDVVTYTIRVYNEGEIDGYAQKVSDDISEYLEYLPANEINKEYRWVMYDAQGKETTDINKAEKITTDYLSKENGEEMMKKDSSLTKNLNLLKAFDGTNLDYRDVKVAFKVKNPSSSETIIINKAQISEDIDEDGEPIDDIDSIPDEWNEGEDDQDIEPVKVQYFDLALRKFITAVGDDIVSTRVPQVKYENGNITYEHDKTPVNVLVGDVVTYTIRVYNEGEIDGYAQEISDNIPEYLEYLPENETNKQYRWIMYDAQGKETTDINKAEKITTDYLSKENGEEMMKKDSSLTKNPNLLKPFDGTTLYHKDVKVAFKVKDPSSSKIIIINKAQISEDIDEDGNPIDDIDSIPDKWNEGEDDQDIEPVKVQYFDLALKKYVTKVITIENGVENVRQTGHTGDENPEPVVKVDLHRKKLSAITVKFGYTIKVTNEGDIAGYVKEITDYIPEGLKFVASDNKDWKDEGNNVISTRLLENTLLQPGESASVEVVLTWINGANNIGLKTNIAEISEDDNDYDIPDRDSTPDNKVPEEDDIDDAQAILSIATGQARIYYVLGLSILVILASGIIIVKKFII